MVICVALDDPIVWVLILGVVIFLFGSSKIPQFARSLGQARKEFDNGWKGITTELTKSPTSTAAPVTTVAPSVAPATTTVSETTPAKDPLIVACESEGITTVGKTREQLASELSWKLSKK